MIIIRRQNLAVGDGFVVVAFDTITKTILKSWRNQKAITDLDLTKLTNFQPVKSILRHTADRLKRLIPDLNKDREKSMSVKYFE